MGPPREAGGSGVAKDGRPRRRRRRETQGAPLRLGFAGGAGRCHFRQTERVCRPHGLSDRSNQRILPDVHHEGLPHALCRALRRRLRRRSTGSMRDVTNIDVTSAPCAPPTFTPELRPSYPSFPKASRDIVGQRVHRLFRPRFPCSPVQGSSFLSDCHACRVCLPVPWQGSCHIPSRMLGGIGRGFCGHGWVRRRKSGST